MGTESAELLEACRMDDLEMVQKLLKHPEIDPNPRKDFGWTPLHLACYRGQLEIVRELLQHPGIDPHLEDICGWTPLYVACVKAHLEIVRELLKHRKVDPNLKDNSGWTPIFVGCRTGHLEILQELLKHPRINPNPQDRSRRTPLFVACRQNFIKVARILICCYKATQQPLDLSVPKETTSSDQPNQKQKPKNLVDYCQERNFTELAELLSSYQEDPEGTANQIRREEGWDGLLFLLVSLLGEGYFQVKEKMTKEMTKGEVEEEEESLTRRFLGIMQDHHPQQTNKGISSSASPSASAFRPLPLELRMLICRLTLPNRTQGLEGFFLCRDLSDLVSKHKEMFL